MDKASARHLVRRALAATSAEQRTKWSQEIVAQLLVEPLFLAAPCVLLFAALPSEPDLLPLLTHPYSEGKKFAFPRVIGPELELRWVRGLRDFQSGTLGIREPTPLHCPLVAPQEISLACIPGLAFDPQTGMRLGRGRGYYDRFLAESGFHGIAWGICFPPQLFAALPTEHHDLPVQKVIHPGVWPTP